MQLLRREVMGERRVSLIEYVGWFKVSIEVRGPLGWENISLPVDQDLSFATASRRYTLRLTEQQTRAIEPEREV